MKPLPSSPSPGRGRPSAFSRIRDNAMLYGLVLILCTASCLAGVAVMTVTSIGVCTAAFKGAAQ